MIKNGNGIYNTLDKDDISRYLTIWEDITSKVGHLNTSLSNGGVVILLNRSLQLLDISGWAIWSSLQTSTKKMFEFNTDLPSSESDRLFFGDVIARINPDHIVGLVSVRPYNFSSDNSQSWSISCRRETSETFSYKSCDSWWRMYRVSPTRKDAFYQYLDNH